MSETEAPKGAARTRPGLPPEASESLHAVARAIAQPVESFLQIQAASGIVLMVNALLALVIANSALSADYERLLSAPIGLILGPITISHSLRFWINDGLMAIFFFVVGLEIRREIHGGELSDLRRAALPVCAALGGMIVPALVYFALNPSGPAKDGWAIPMATDIAFAVGVLTLLGTRVPAALRVFLLALAIIDDIGAILVIAIFYGHGFDPLGLVVAAAGIGMIVFMQKLGVRHAILYFPPALVIWAGALRAGIHPTIAGVAVGLMTPVRVWLDERRFLSLAQQRLEDFRERARQPSHSEHDLVEPLTELDKVRREAISPVERLESAFHPWVAYGVMPVFALANAGVSIADVRFGAAELRLALGVGLGLVVGKGVGVLAASWLAVKSGLAVLPHGVTTRGLLLVGGVAGIGFTMSLFIGDLAFAESPLLPIAKLAVLIASGTAALGSTIYGLLALRPGEAEGAASAHEAEQSTEK